MTKSMTPHDVNKQVALLSGYVQCAWQEAFVVKPESGVSSYPKNYFGSVETIMEAVEALPYELQSVYTDRLTHVLMKDEGVSDFDKHNARAPQRCAAFLAAHGKINIRCKEEINAVLNASC